MAGVPSNSTYNSTYPNEDNNLVKSSSSQTGSSKKTQGFMQFLKETWESLSSDKSPVEETVAKSNGKIVEGIEAQKVTVTCSPQLPKSVGSAFDLEKARQSYWKSSDTRSIPTLLTVPQTSQSSSYPPNTTSKHSTIELGSERRPYSLSAPERLVPSHLRTTAFDNLKLEQRTDESQLEQIKKISLCMKQFQQTIKGVKTFQDQGEFDSSFQKLHQLGQQIEQQSSNLGGSSINNYPNTVPLAQVYCDAFHAEDYGDYTFSLIADGCGWGSQSRQAAQRAIAGATNYIKQVLKNSPPKTAQELACHLLQSIAVAHDAILIGKEDVEAYRIGTTTLNICFRFMTEDGKKYLLTAGVGDSKVFAVFKGIEGDWQVKEVMGGREPNQEIQDSGGRLGPYVGPKKIDPDLRNLVVTCFLLPSEECLIFNMTDGLYDNLQPQLQGKEPHEIDSEYQSKTWDDLTPEEKSALDADYQKKCLMSLIKETLDSGKTNLDGICAYLTKYCHDLTAPVRLFMQENPTKREPKDKKQYKGKMDHCSVVAFK